MRLVLLFFLCFGNVLFAQNGDDLIAEIKNYHAEENKKFATAETTILTEKDFKTFKELEFYPIDLKYRIEAKFVRTPDETPFEMSTTTDRVSMEVKYGELHFIIDGKKLQLNVYQSVPPMEDPEYIDYLFLPFTDLTSGDGSYGGGRFIDARIPEGNSMIIDFNKAYNPYCAYNYNFSCPIPPKENHLDIPVEAGVKAFGEH